MIAGLSGEAKDAQQKIFEAAKEAMKALPEDQREAACRESLKGMQGTADSAAEETKEAASEAAEDAKEAAEDAREAASDAKEAAQEAAEEAKEKAE